MISIIVAIDQKRGIGKNNDLLFRIKEDFQRMKQLTTSHPIIMGRKTFESIGRVLPNRLSIIVTRDVHYQVDGAFVVNSLEKALEVGKKNEEEKVVVIASNAKQSQDKEIATVADSSLAMTQEQEIFIFGGGEIFRQALPLVDRLYLTIVKGDYGADTFFPEYEKEFTKVIGQEDHQEGNYSFTFLTLER